ncbi:hypothetical protein ACG95N_00440 [Acinetobacter guillouiae]|uniref:hypothetical protein n=1 Tax=Acinetobacter guillouiae TaxID=106649 RepID=UPI003AF565B5
MQKLKNLALYREIRRDAFCSEPPSLDDYKYVLSEDRAEEIVQYLESGFILREYVSPIRDPYDQNDLVPFVIYTDGIYVWYGVTINWVRKYRVALPEEFLKHYYMVKNNPNFLKNIDYDKIYDKWYEDEDIEEIFMEE